MSRRRPDYEVAGLAGSRLIALVFFVIGAAALILSVSVSVSSVAVYHDEVWNQLHSVGLARGESVNPAFEVQILGFPLPIVSGPYQGAIKTWVFAPLLMIFGTSPWALRGTNLLLALAYLFTLYWALRPVLPRTHAALVFLLPLANPRFLLFVPLDQGPFLFQCLFLGLAFGSVIRAWKSGSRRFAILGLFATSLLLCDKLTGIPVVLASLGTAALVLRRRLLSWLTGRSWILFLCAGLLPLVPMGIYFALRGFDSLRSMTSVPGTAGPSYWERLSKSVTRFLVDSNGHAWNESLTGKGSTDAMLPFFAILVSLGIAVGLVVLLTSRSKEPSESRGGDSQADNRAAFGIAFLLLTLSLLFYPLFRGLDRPWHYLILGPPFVLTAVLGLGLGLHRKRGMALRSTSAGLAGLLLLASCYGAWTELKQQDQRKGAAICSPGLYEVQDALTAAKPSRITSLSYSLERPLRVLSFGKLRIEGLEFVDFDKLDPESLRRRLQEPGHYIIFREIHDTSVDAAWVRGLNRGSRYFREKIETQTKGLRVKRFRDVRGTVFGMAWIEQ